MKTSQIKLKTSLKSYPEYKDSGIDWIGEIPKDWDAQKIVSVFDFPNEKVTELTHDPLSVTYGGVKKQIENAAKVAEGSSRKLVKVGDIAINGRSDRKGAVGMSEYEGGVSLVYNVLRKRNKSFDSKYFHYVFRNTLFSEEFYRWGRGIVDDLWTTRESEMKRIFIPVPEIQEQKKIAHYLDEKTELIDQIVEKKKKLIELLKEKRTAIINQAVTKGLDPNAELVDSGIDWIGKIPKDWQVEKLKFLFNFQSGDGFPEDVQGMISGDVPFLKVSDINKDEKFVTRSNNYVSLAMVSNRSWHLINEGSILTAKIGAALSRNYRKVNKLPVCIDNNMMAMIPKGNVKENFAYWLSITINMTDYQNISSVPSINMGQLKNSYFSLPPTGEQNKISVYLDQQVFKYDNLMKRVEESIQVLKEFKSSLISNVVTGKVKV